MIVGGVACKDSEETDGKTAEQKEAAPEIGEVTLLYNTDENHKLVAESIQDMWKRNLKVSVKLNNKEWKTYLQDVDTLSYNIARAGWIGDYNDPMTFLGMFETGNGNNDTGWSNEEYDSLLEKARMELDPEKRRGILQKAEEILMTEGPVIPIYYYTTHGLRASALKGFEPHNRDVHLLKYMSLGEPEEGAEFVAGSKADMLTFALAADPETFDTAKMSGAPEGRISFNLFEGLMMPNVTTEELEDPSEIVVYGVAESHELSEDGKTYTFNLREDAKWSNGEALTAQDFVESWKRVLTPGFAADYASMLYVIDGAEAFNKKETEDWSTVGVKALDEHTLQVKLRAPTPYFLELLAFYTFFPTPKSVIDEHGDDWTKPENIVTNGPYELASYEPQQELVLEKNSDYWGADDLAIDKAKFRIIPDANARVTAYKTGELHWVSGLPVAQITGLLTHPDHYQEPMLGTYYYRINVSDENSPLANPKVRRALSMAIDRDSLVNNTLNGLYEVATSYVPPMAGYESTTTTEYSIKSARDLLDEGLSGAGAEEQPSIEGAKEAPGKEAVGEEANTEKPESDQPAEQE
jgi:oligopeptide transport system substrate-binding protein